MIIKNDTNKHKRLKMNEPTMHMEEFDYDYLVIGGGSGGIASAKRAASHGAKVAGKFTNNGHFCTNQVKSFLSFICLVDYLLTT